MEIDISVLSSVKDEERGRSNEIMAKLLKCWAIPRCKNLETRQDYDFIANHKGYFDTVLHMCGFGGLTLKTATGKEVAYITGREGELGRRFNKDESIVLLRLLQEYLHCGTRVSLSGGNTDMFVGDLMENINVTRRVPMDEKELLKVLSTLDTYNFIQLDLRKKAEFCKETILTIMPSVSCLLPYATIESIDEQLRDYAKETSKRSKTEDDREQTENSAEGDSEEGEELGD